MAGQDPEQTLLAITQAVGPATALLARRLFEQALQEACLRCLDLLCYARWFTPARVEHAALRLIDHGVHDVASLRLVLEDGLEMLRDGAGVELDGQLLLDFAANHQSRRT
jgi:hypothetical protein